MGCQSQVTLGNNLTFSICTHDPDTGVLTDADSAPAYRVYEDETATAILTGTMATLDTANTTGFYSEQIACTAANGFEADKSYTVYIEATVDGDTGGISYGFAVVSIAADVWAYSPRTLTQSAASVAAAVSGSDITIHRGDSLSVAITDLGDISGRTMLWFTVKTSARDADTAAIVQIEEAAGLVYINGATAATPANGSITVDDAVAGDITIVLDEVETAKLLPDSLVYDVQVLDSGNVTTLTAADATVAADVTRAVA